MVLIASCLQTTGIENRVCQYSGFSSALVLASLKILKVCSNETVETLLFLSSYSVLHAAFFFNMYAILFEGISTYYQYSRNVYTRILARIIHEFSSAISHWFR